VRPRVEDIILGRSIVENKRIPAQAKIVAVEADPLNFALLVMHTAHQPNIFPVHAAV
jgi:hypothetical protein